MKRVTKATVTKALKNLDLNGVTVELDSTRVAFWLAEGADEALVDAACEAVEKATGATTRSSNGYHTWIYYKSSAPADLGDFNSLHSKHHY